MSFATFGAGCFWGVQAIIGNLPGVIDTEVGYMGGHVSNPTYQQISTGTTGHAEVVRVKYDPKKITYEELLSYFWRLHDPTTVDRQGYDIGNQYRSVIFYHEPEHEVIAKASKAAFDLSGVFKNPAVTQILPATQFWKGEDYHQDYYAKKYEGKGGPICHTLRAR